MAPVTIDPETEDKAWELETSFRYDETYIAETADDTVYQLTGE